jgi:segregation and condensation protein A
VVVAARGEELAPGALEGPFVVVLPGFTGTVGELAHVLRSRALAPGDVDLYRLVRGYLDFFERAAARDLELATEALPRVAQVVELKLRLLLPRQAGTGAEEGEELALEEALEAVALLEELEHAIDFLRRRREERRLVLPARAPRPPYARPPRPLRASKDDLARLAGRYRLGGYFEIALPGATVASVAAELARRLKRAARGPLFALLGAEDWRSRTLAFAAMLELVRQGRVRATQAEPYGPIEVAYAGDGDGEAADETVA